jgi:MFS family permease
MTAFVTDQIGSWSYLIVISVYVFDRTHSTQWLAILTLCSRGPCLLLCSYGGVLADRYQRVTVLIVSGLASTVLMAGMAAVVATAAPVGFVLALSALSSVAATPYQPAAGALTPEIVSEKDLAAANSMFSALENLVVVIGPAIGGLLLLTGRPFIGVMINAVSFLLSAVVISRLRVRSRGSGEDDGGTLRQLTSGFRALAGKPVALAVVLFCALDSAGYGVTTVLYVPLSIRLGTGPNGSSYLLAGSALGGLIGAVLANRLSGASRLAPVIMASICVQSLPFLATIPLHTPWLAAILQLISGIGMIIVDVLALTTLQRDLAGDMLGRVLGAFGTVTLAGLLLASLVTGILLAHVSLDVMLALVGLGLPALGLVGLPVLLRADGTLAAAADRLRPIVDLLSELDLLAGADRSTLERLAAAATGVVVPAGTVLIRQGDEAEALWILTRGELSVSVAGDGPQPRELAPVTAPGYVGELGLLHGIPRTATVVTSQDSTLLRISGQDFLSALQTSRPSPSLLSVAGVRLARTPGQR